MILRRLGHRAQELDAAGRLYLLSDSIPVAMRQEGEYVRTDRFFSKATTGHINQWLKQKEIAKARVVAHDTIAEAFASIDSSDRRAWDRRNGAGIAEVEQAEFRLWRAERELAELRGRMDPSRAMHSVVRQATRERDE